MSEVASIDGATAGGSAGTTSGATAGTLLREAREAAGLHVATLAATLKVPVPKIEALEQDRYDLLPDAVFVRALASSMCRTLKIDPQPVLERLPRTGQPRLVQDTEHINAPFRTAHDGPAPRWFDQVSRPVLATVVLLLLGALVIFFLPYVQHAVDSLALANKEPGVGQVEPVMPPPGAAATVPSGPVEVAAVPPGSAASNAMPAQPPASGAGPAPTAAAITQAPNAQVTPGSAPAAAASSALAPAATASAPQAAASGPIDANGVVAFRTTGQSWVQVTDAHGKPVYRKLMDAGETASASGPLPLAVTVGNAESTQVQVRGQSYDLAPVTHGHVARFQVK
jgi:cytoskeleton protein RodZ